jgi:hypothetical protein
MHRHQPYPIRHSKCPAVSHDSRPSSRVLTIPAVPAAPPSKRKVWPWVTGGVLLLAAVGAVLVSRTFDASAGPRIIREDLMSKYIAQATRLYASDPTYGYLYQNGMDDQGRHNAELTGRQMCAVIIAGVPPEKAYAAAYPSVAAAGNVGALEVKDGQLAAAVLCPATG